MERMQCDNCGYVYDKDQGDEKNGIAPGTAWADVYRYCRYRFTAGGSNP